MGGATLLLLFGGPAGSTTAATLPGAIVARWNATPALAFVTGGLTYGLAGEDAGDCYATFFLVSEPPTYTTGPGYWRRVTYQFSCYGPVGDDAPERMKEAIMATFNPFMAPLQFAGGTTFAAFPQNAVMSPEEVDARSGLLLHCQMVDVAFLVNRSLQP